jgi:protein-S-isoprenylcysteine O-methyltransferase Ste14
MTSARTTVSERVEGEGRTWTDWVGFFVCFGLVVLILSTPGEMKLLLLPPVLYELAVGVTFLVRGRARRTLTGLGPRVAAYTAGFIVPIFVRAALEWRPEWLAATPSLALRNVGGGLWLAGLVIGFWPLWCLRRSFSIEPAARELVATGPYMFARHPIYAAHLVGYAGSLMLHATPPFALVMLVWFVALRVRIGYEERVLTEAFPEYASYRQRVGAFGPRLARPVTAPERA